MADPLYEEALDRVTYWLRFLQPSFPNAGPRVRCYNHLLALLVDVSLQAAVNYERVVRPRVAHVLCNFSHCACTSSILRQLQRVSVEELLQWRGVEKIERFRRLLELLVEYHIGSVDDLCFWSATSTGRCELLQVKGIGNKTYDYLRMLCGQITFPIDRHIIRFLQMADVDIRSYGYETSQRLLFDSCGRLGADPGVIERGLWALMRSCV